MPFQSRKLTQRVSPIGTARKRTSPRNAGAANSQPVVASRRCRRRARRGPGAAVATAAPWATLCTGVEVAVTSEDALAGLGDRLDHPLHVRVAADQLLELRVEFGDDVHESRRELPWMGVLGAVKQGLELWMVLEPLVA